MNLIVEWHSLRVTDKAVCLTLALHTVEDITAFVLDAKTTRHVYRAKRSVSKGGITLFEIALPLCELADEETLEVVVCNQSQPLPVTYKTSTFFPLCESLTQAYCLLGGFCITRQGNTLRLCRNFKHWKQELLLCLEILRTCRKRRFEVLGVRLWRFLRRTPRRPLWLLMDRPLRADDNAEALALYLKQHYPEIDVRFVLKRGTPDWKRLRKVLPLVPYGSRRHRILNAFAEVFVSSDAFRPSWYTALPALRDVFALQPFVFLQHGIIKDDLSGWLWKYNQNLAGFVTSWEREYQHILTGGYGYTEREVWLTGLPRFDRLYSASKGKQKQITIMPTWRRWLMAEYFAKKGKWILKDDFEQSEWVQFWTAFLNHPRLHQLAQAYDCKIAFLMHPSLASANARLTAPNVTFLPPETSYREVYALRDCVITDYSSAVFDFAYLQKPILYAQFDRDRIWSGEHTTMKSDIFDYEHDGFGEVVLSVDELLDALQRVLVNDCQLAPIYQQRVQSFFPYRDCANCERVYKQIVSILKSDNTNVSL